MGRHKKEIVRDQFFKIRVSKEEKEIFEAHAKDLGINTSRLARNLMMIEAESYINKYINNNFIKAYIHYKKVTGDEEFMKKISED